MSDEHTLAGSITSIVGDDHISVKPELAIDGIKPQMLVRPGSAEQVAACMRACAESGASVIPAGRMTWLDCGNPATSADVVLSLDRMRRVIDYSSPDLTATVEAGLTLSEFNAMTLQERQWLPLDPPGFSRCTLGAIAACNSIGALRLGFGTPRDYVIGLKLVHADGTESKSGGKVVKNVAGYDMNKLYVGSYGSLAIISELTFKLRPLADRSSTLVITSKDHQGLFQFANRLLATDLQPASVILTRRLLESVASSATGDALLIRFIDSDAAVKHQADWVIQSAGEECKAALLSENEAAAVWARVADFDERAVQVRLSVPLSAVPGEFNKAFVIVHDCVASADIGTGTIRLAFDGDEGSAVEQIRRLRRGVTDANGTLVVERASTNVRRQAEAWGDVGSTSELMRSIKSRFDPRSLLNPGKFVLGL